MKSEAEVTIRPLGRWRVTGWAFCTFGVLFGLAGLGGGDTGATVMMMVFGLLMATAGMSVATALVRVDADRVLYRHGWIRRVKADDVAGIRLGPGSGGFYDRLAIFVDRRRGTTVRLTALQLPATDTGRARLAAHVADMERALDGSPQRTDWPRTGG